MLITRPLNHLFDRAQDAVARRIRRDRRRASERLGPVFDHIAERFYDVDLTLDDMERRGVVDGPLRDRFRKEMGLAIKPYLLSLKADLARWLLGRTHLLGKHVAVMLGYSRAYNFSRDFHEWTGRTPEQFRAERRGWSSVHGPESGRSERAAAAWERIRARLGIELSTRNRHGLAAVPPGTLFVSRARFNPELQARMLWEIVREETPSRQRRLLRHDVVFGGPELFELLSRISREMGRRNRRRGVEIAELALATVEGSALLLGDRYAELHALALARLGNARRLAGDPEGANEAFRHAQALWQPVEGQIQRRVKAEILDLEASLRLFERRFDQALELLKRSLQISGELGDVQLRVRSLLQRVALKRQQGRTTEMVADLGELRDLIRIEAEPEPRQLLGVYQELALAHLDLGDAAEAGKYLGLAKNLCKDLDHPMSRHQLQWIEGRIASNNADPVKAERLFRKARAGFIELGDRLTAALAAAELAILCHDQGRCSEVVSLVADDVLPVIEEVRRDDECRVASRLLREAVAVDAVSAAPLRKVREILCAILRDPSGRGST